MKPSHTYHYTVSVSRPWTSVRRVRKVSRRTERSLGVPALLQAWCWQLSLHSTIALPSEMMFLHPSSWSLACNTESSQTCPPLLEVPTRLESL